MNSVSFFLLTAFILFNLTGCGRDSTSSIQGKPVLETGTYVNESGDAFEIWKAYLDTSTVFKAKFEGKSRIEAIELFEDAFSIMEKIEIAPLFDIHQDNRLTTVFLTQQRILENDTPVIMVDRKIEGRWSVKNKTLKLATGVNDQEMRAIIKSDTSFMLMMEMPGEVIELKTSIYTKK